MARPSYIQRVGADSTPQSLAEEGLRNVDIATILSLHSTVRGGRRNYLTYSVLGGLLAEGKVVWDERTKLYIEA